MFPSQISNNPSFYRAHQYRNQGDMPDGAFKNRESQSYFSQIPRGKQYFQPTNKKHYQNRSYRSQIDEHNVMKEKYTEQQIEKSRIAMDKSYFRSLNVDDIEGAKPNTLISKAIKNKQKALHLKKDEIRLQQNRKRNYSNINDQPQSFQRLNSKYYNMQQLKSFQNLRQKPFPISNMHQEAVGKFNRGKSILQNNSMRVLNTYSQLDQPDQSFGNNSAVYNYHYRPPQIPVTQPLKKSNDFIQRQLEQKERRIRQLERELEITKIKTEVRQDHGQMQAQQNKPLNTEQSADYQANNQLYHNYLQNSWDKQGTDLNNYVRNHLGPVKQPQQIPKPQPYQPINKANVRRYNPTFLSYQSDASLPRRGYQ